MHGVMIEFKCHCGQPFSVENDQAGGLIQCPRCGRLNDVPMLSDLKHLDADGNYQLTDLEIVEEPDRLGEVTKAFQRKRVDERGEEIDLRPTLDDVQRAGIEEIPLSVDDRDLPGTPKYDPLTGELIEPIKIAPVPTRPPIQDLPVAKPVLGYAHAGTPDRAENWSLWRLGLELLRPVNMAVMVFVILLQAVMAVALVPIAMGLYFLAPLMILPIMALYGFFGKVIEETGPMEQDDLPRPLGSLSLRDDIWSPFVGMFGANILAFLPLVALRLIPATRQAPDVVFLLAVGLGVFVAPALMLTLLTSGSTRNLRPDRVIGVMTRCGQAYLAVVVLYLLSILSQSPGFVNMLLGMGDAMARGKIDYSLVRLAVTFGGWLIGMYLMCWTCWGIGLLYRRHHDQFPWVLQRHIPKNRTTQGPIRAPRRPSPSPPAQAR